MFRHMLLAAVVFAPGLCAQAPVLPAAASKTVEFQKDVEPLLRQRCQGCHGGAMQSSGLRLDRPDAAIKGGFSGPAIVPGKSAESALIQRVASGKKGFAMPPVGQPLTAAEVGILRAWIDQGAKWPAPALAAAPAGNSKSSHWSFQPIRRPEPPAVQNRPWVRNEIDHFVLARLESEGIAPSPEASKATLLRRLSFDLTGLPPTPAELTAFLADNRPDAYEREVDRLLASPHYGERWARQWLDLAHYADSDGYEKDLVRPHAWRYRQWVIDALNRDMPFDQFTVEQLAGDLLPHATADQRIATGFLRQTLTNREAGVDRKEARFEQLVNRTNTVSTVWMGLTTGCAQCHNHKFDPIAQKEYYQLMAFFNRADEDEMDAPMPGELGPYLQARPEYDRKRKELLTKYDIPALQATFENNLLTAMANPGQNLEWDFMVTEFRAMYDGGERIIHQPVEKRRQADQERLTSFLLNRLGPDFNRDKEISAKIKECRAKIQELDATLPRPSRAMVMYEMTDPPEEHVRVRGDYKTLGAKVDPDTPAVLPPMEGKGQATRLTLARWLVSRENPLTARVTVNRVWQEFFGRGLVRTSEDFGTQGEKPSHPELLDWLARGFRDDGWSLKRLQRTIVLSATYRQSSHARPELSAKDPENELLARQSRLRLPAEYVRDAALSASGLLNTAIGGKSIRPPQPAGVAELGYANNVKWVANTGPERYRRGLYVHFQRTTPYPMLMNFDEPDSNLACSRRRRSNTPLQALNLLNDPVFFEAAQALAVRTLRESEGGRDGQIDYAFALALSRQPSAREHKRLLALWDQQMEQLKATDKERTAFLDYVPEGADPTQSAALVGVSRVLLNLDEFMTRE